jgi:aspartate 1-decarboxylase
MHLLKALKSKIHGATVTHANVGYEGSVTLSPELLEAADMFESEAICVWNVSNGERFETYIILGEQGSTDICINGAAAHKAKPGDTVILATYSFFTRDEMLKHKPKLVFVTPQNSIKHSGPEVAGPKIR